MEKIVEYGDPIDIMTVTERIFEKPWDFFAQRVPHSRHAIVKAVKAVDRLVWKSSLGFPTSLFPPKTKSI